MKHESLACPAGVAVPRPEPVPRVRDPCRDGKAALDVLMQLSGAGRGRPMRRSLIITSSGGIGTKRVSSSARYFSPRSSYPPPLSVNRLLDCGRELDRVSLPQPLAGR
jgi:hypothetical protein